MVGRGGKGPFSASAKPSSPIGSNNVFAEGSSFLGVNSKGRHYSEESHNDSINAPDFVNSSVVGVRGASPNASVTDANLSSSAGGVSWLPPPDPGNSTSLYYSQELARKDRELVVLQRVKRDLELSMREIQHAAVTKELQLFHTIESLKEQIRSLEARLSRRECDDSHIEYLKNVLVQYMLCSSADGKHHMLKAISAALKLTPKEMDQINAKMNIFSIR